MQAIRVGDATTLVFTKVLDELVRGVVDEDEDARAAPTDRQYWENRTTQETVSLADQMLERMQIFDSSLNLKYNKFYIGIEKNGQPFNFVSFRPKKNYIVFEIKLPQTDQTDQQIEETGLNTLEYNKRSGLYKIRLSKDDISTKSEILDKLSNEAYTRKAST